MSDCSDPYCEQRVNFVQTWLESWVFPCSWIWSQLLTNYRTQLWGRACFPKENKGDECVVKCVKKKKCPTTSGISIKRKRNKRGRELILLGPGPCGSSLGLLDPCLIVLGLILWPSHCMPIWGIIGLPQHQVVTRKENVMASGCLHTLPAMHICMGSAPSSKHCPLSPHCKTCPDRATPVHVQV